MKISDKLLETVTKLCEQGADGPFAFRMPVAVAAKLLQELEVTHVPASGIFEWNGHKIIAEDRIEVLAIDRTIPQAANEP